MTEMNPYGREWLLTLAAWFEHSAGKIVQINREKARSAAEGLRQIAASGDMENELERWYKEVGNL